MAELNAAQRQAVTATPHAILQILAGPGSGKTKVLTHRVCFLLEQGMRAENIILTTFTNKAAREMKQRIGKLGGNGAESKLITGTFHAICRRYLVKYGSLINLPKGFGIADTDDTTSILKKLVTDLRSSIEVNEARQKISVLKSNGISAEQNMENNFSMRKVTRHSEKSQTSFEMAQIFLAYERKLESMNLLDFDDLLLRTCALLRLHPQCISNIQHVLIDEFQDTNTVQYTLMRLFAQSCHAISIVGDPDQGIYGWRSANAGNLKQMRADYRDVQVVNLEENYRSSTWILKLSMAVIEQDPARFAKGLIGTKQWGLQPVLRTLADVHLEARWIAREIRRVMGLTGGMIGERDVAILVRTASLTRPIESALASAGLRYRMVGGRKFFDREEIKDILAYLRVIHSPKDSAALLRIINVPNRRMGKERIATLVNDSESNSRPLWESLQALVSGELPFPQNNRAAEIALSALARTLESARQRFAARLIPNVAELIDFVRNKVRYDDHLRKKFGPEGDERIGNLEELKSFAGEIERITGDNQLPEIGVGEEEKVEESALERFLGNISLMTDVRDSEEDNIDYITMSTIHAAKGLEWPVVFIPGVYQGSIPHLRAEEVDEERRLLYVAMTRAQGLLYLSFPGKSSNGDKTNLSIFVQQPNIEPFLATRASAIDAKDLAAILNRPVPSNDEISNACLKLSSIHDDDWIEGPKSKKGDAESATTAVQRIREWRPQTTVGALHMIDIGCSTTTIGHTTNIVGLNKLTLNMGGITTGFMNGREALSILPTESTTTNINKRKADHPLPQKTKARAPKQSTLTSWIAQEEPTRGAQTREIKAKSSGIVRDRGKRRALAATTLPADQSSSPARGYDLDALPSLSFSSPTRDVKYRDEEPESPLAKPGKRFIVEEPPAAPFIPRMTGQATATGGVSARVGLQRRSLGIRRDMKPWPAVKG